MGQSLRPAVLVQERTRAKALTCCGAIRLVLAIAVRFESAGCDNASRGGALNGSRRNKFREPSIGGDLGDAKWPSVVPVFVLPVLMLLLS